MGAYPMEEGKVISIAGGGTSIITRGGTKHEMDSLSNDGGRPSTAARTAE
jgi:hypothetical protein